MSDKENSAPKKSRFRTARGWVAFACVAFALAGMAFRVGIGTPSAFGIQQISAICPLGALETMAGAKSVMLHPLLLFALVVVLIALVGKAFCAWMCPVPWLQRFFRPKKRSVAKGGVGHGVSAKSGAAREAAAKADAGRDASGLSGAGCDASVSCCNPGTGLSRAKPLTPGASEARESQIKTDSGANRQKARECVLAAVDECSNDTHDAATAASEQPTPARQIPGSPRSTSHALARLLAAKPPNLRKRIPPARRPHARLARARRRARRCWPRWEVRATACSWIAAMRCWWGRWLPLPCSVSRCFASSARSA